MTTHTKGRARRRVPYPNQFDLLALIDDPETGLIQVPAEPATKPGAMEMDDRIRDLLNQAIRTSAFNREQIAASMTALAGREITKAQLDSWTGARSCNTPAWASCGSSSATPTSRPTSWSASFRFSGRCAMREWFTAAELAAKALPGLPGTDRAIQLRASRENWLRRKRAARGGGYEYPITAQPEEARITIMREPLLVAGAAGAAIARRDRVQGDLRRKGAEAGRQAGLAEFMKLGERRQREADAKALIVRACDDYIARLRLPKKRGRELFAHEYAEGRIPVEDWVRAQVPSFCSGSIENWRGKLQNEGLASLVGKYGQHRKGTGIIDTNEDMKKLVLGMLVDHPHVSAKLVMRAIRARFKGGDLPSYRTLQRFMANWKADNEQMLAAVTNPDDWRSKYQAVGGDAAAKIIRLNQHWEFDSTKADLMLADNYRHVIVGSIDCAVPG